MKNINYFVEWIVEHVSTHIHSQQDNLWLKEKFSWQCQKAEGVVA